MTKFGKKNVLLISQLFPPIQCVGAIRTAFFTKYLPYYGWRPIVLTIKSHPLYPSNDTNFPGLPPEKDILRIHGAEPEIGKDILSRLRRLPYKLFFPELCGLKNFYREMVKTARKILTEKNIDVIFSSAGPEATHRMAARLYKEFGIPWVADFRDIPDQFTPKRLIDKYQLKLIKLNQKSILSSAKALVTVSHGLAEQLSKRLGRDVAVIYNGYDSDIYHKTTINKFDKFNITYAGSNLIWDSNPSLFFKAVDTLVDSKLIDKNDIRISFIGIDSGKINIWSQGFKCKDRIEIVPKLPYVACQKKIAESCILLHLSYPRKQKGILTTKLFEYLGAKRPIITVPGDNDGVDDILSKTNSGVSCGDIECIISTLAEWYNEWKETGSVAFFGKQKEIFKYTRKSQAGQLAEILNKTARSQIGV